MNLSLTLYNVLSYAIATTSLACLLSAAFLTHTGRRQTDRGVRRIFFFFASLCFTVGLDRFLAGITMGGATNCRALSASALSLRIFGCAIVTGAALILALRLAGLINGHKNYDE